MLKLVRQPPRRIAIGWLVSVMLIGIVAFSRGAVFDSSILTLLPESGQQPLVQTVSDHLADEFSRRLVLLVSAVNDTDARAAVEVFAAKLDSLEVVARTRWRISESEAQRLQSELFPYRFQLLDVDSRKQLQRGNSELLRERALIRLFAPVGAGSGNLVADPFALHGQYLQQLGSGLKLDRVQGMLKLRNSREPTYLLELELAGDPFSPGLQQALLSTIDATRAQLDHQISQLQMSGMLRHAAAGVAQAKSEISTIGLGSLGGILILMLYVFGRAKPLLLVLLPILVGCLFASAVTLLIFGQVHLVTFAFGVGLVGVSIDYALHFLCERRYSPVDQVLPRILTGLSLGLFSSVMAYAVMLFTPFPGLRQMATFSVAGLFASWTTVILCLPGFTVRDDQRSIPLAATLGRMRNRFPRLLNHPVKLAAVALVSFFALAVIWNSDGRDDVRLLQTSPPELLLEEQEIRQLLGGTGSARFILVRGANLEACLQAEESITPQLQQLVADGLIDGFVALSESLPSLQRQQENYTLVTQLYEQQLDALYSVIQVPGLNRERAQAELHQANSNRLSEAAWQALALSKLNQGLVVQRNSDTVATVIRFEGVIDAAAEDALVAISEQQAAAIYVDRIADMSSMLRDYRGQIQTWIGIAYVIVMLILLLRYRRQVWRIVTPPLLASVFTLALLVQLEQGINLFHLIALILVLGIGLDMGIFMQETNGAESTWLAVSLSAFTSLLAFGLLALSKTPVLHHFGITVAIGLILVWLLSPMVRDEPGGQLQ